MVKNPPASAGDIRDMGSIPGLRRSPGGGPSNSLEYSCLENPHGRRSLVGCSPVSCKESGLVQTHAPALQADSLLSEPPGGYYNESEGESCSVTSNSL